MARVIMSWHKASISEGLCGFREVTRFAKVNSFLLAIGPPGNVDQRRKMRLQALVGRPDLERTLLKQGLVSNRAFKKCISKFTYILAKCY